MSLKSRVEAVLFLTDKPVVAAVVAKLVNEDVQLVRQAILELIHDYEERNSALEIADDDDGYMMQVKDEYANLANNLAPIDLPVSAVRTLSAIAIKQPVLQSEIVRIRGAGAYEHIKDLLEKDLITKKEEGRSSLLSTTKKFQEYFRLSQDAKALRYQLKDNAKELATGDAEIPAEQQLQLPLDSEPAIAGAQAVAMDGQILDEPAIDILQEVALEEVIFQEEAPAEQIAAGSQDIMQTEVMETFEFAKEEPDSLTELETSPKRKRSTKNKPSEGKEAENESEREDQLDFAQSGQSSSQENNFEKNQTIVNNSQPVIKNSLTQMPVIN